MLTFIKTFIVIVFIVSSPVNAESLKDKVQNALDAGYSSEEIRMHLKDKYVKAMADGYSIEEIDEYLGLSGHSGPTCMELSTEPARRQCLRDLVAWAQSAGGSPQTIRDGLSHLYQQAIVEGYTVEQFDAYLGLETP